MFNKFDKAILFLIVVALCYVMTSFPNMLLAQKTDRQLAHYVLPKEYKKIKSLKTTNGEIIGFMYAKKNDKYRNGVLESILLLKVGDKKLDTLYQIDSKGDFINQKGKIELQGSSQDKRGFKLLSIKSKFTDLFCIGFTDKKGNLLSDDNNFLIKWNYAHKQFEYVSAP